MAFPQDPRDIRAELYLAGDWVDVSPLVYSRDEIKLKRGRADEQATTAPGSCQLTLNNRDLRFSPRNPIGPYYGQLGRNTPMRLSIRVAADEFGRTVASDWGTADVGGEWDLAGSSGVTLADFNVAAGVGTQAVTAANRFLFAHLAAVVQRDVDIAVTATSTITDVTGASIHLGNVMVRGTSLSDYYYALVEVTADEVVGIGIRHADGTAIAASVVADVEWTGSLRVRMQAEGRTLRAKVWDPADAEPLGWNVDGRVDTVAAGGVGVRSARLSGNTNTPCVISYDDLEVRSPRFAGEVSQWPAVTDVSGEDARVEIEASGILRRLGQGEAPVASASRRYLPSIEPIEYWPLEDGKTATSGQSLTGGTPAYFHQELQLDPPVGWIKWADDTDLPGSLQAPRIWAGGYLVALCRPSLITTDTWTVAWAMRYTAAEGARVFLRTDNAGFTFSLTFFDDGSIEVYLVTSPNFGDSELVMARGLQPTAIYDDVWRHYAIRCDQTGADPLWQFVIDGYLVSSYSTSGLPTGLPASIQWSTSNVDDTGVRVSQIAVTDNLAAVFTMAQAAAGFPGETAGDRIVRLCDEESIPLAMQGDPADTPAMGPQSIDGLVDLLQEVATVDGGTLYETRGTLGLAYRTMASQLNQAAYAEITYSSGELAPPFEPVDDDQQIRNDVKASRPDGGDLRLELTTGPMSTLPPGEGGVGRYDTSITANVQLDDQLADVAGWRLHMGTIDEARFPRIGLNLGNPDTVANAALSAAALDLDVDTPITVDDAVAIGWYDDIRQMVRGYTETLAQFTHEFEFNCTPASALDAAELDDAARLGSLSSALSSSATSTATSLSVATSDDLWTGDDVPFAIRVAGEEMTVTAVSGTSSPQTFTVTRSVNGVVKAQAAGAVVELVTKATLT